MMKLQGKRPRGRHRWRLDDIIKRDLRKITREDMDLINHAQDKVKLGTFMNTIIKLRVP